MTLLSSLDDAHVREISEHNREPEWLQEYRQQSLSVYESLPLETSPLYGKYTDAARLKPDNVRLGNGAGRISSHISERLAELEGQTHVVQLGSSISNISVSPAAQEAGIMVLSIHDALDEMPELVRRALEISSSGEDRFTALNNAAFNTGMFVYVPDGAVLEEPVHMISALLDGGDSAISRNIVYAGRESRATIVQELYSTAESQAYMELLNTVAGSGSRLDVTTLQMMSPDSYNFSTRRTEMDSDSQVNWYLGLFGALLSRYRIQYNLNGRGASANDSEVAFGSGSQSFDIQANMVHNSESTEGRITEKSILRDESRSLFKGMIRINENASKSNSYLSGRSILLSKKAKSDSIPGLEILTNDVKATHSASVAQLDEEQLFYLMARCMSKPAAERTIVEGFLEPLSRRMSTQIRAWIAYLVESKWEGRPLLINTDEELRKFVEVEETRYNENAEIEQHYKYRR